MIEQIASVAIPDTRLVADATELVRQASTPLLFNHSRRVFLFGSLQGARRGLTFDPELLYVGAMFHDLGLTATYRHNDQRFELDGADEARRFLAAHHIPEDSIRRVWLGIALHTTPEVPARLEPEVALVTAGVELDVLGIGYHDLDKAQIDAVLAAYPRPEAAGLRRDHPELCLAAVIRLTEALLPEAEGTTRADGAWRVACRWRRRRRAGARAPSM